MLYENSDVSDAEFPNAHDEQLTPAETRMIE